MPGEDNSAADTVELNDVMSQQEQMLSNSVQFGRIVEKTDTDPKPPTDIASVLVQVGGEKEGTFTRNWMPWTVARSGLDAVWWQPEVDEQVLVMAPSGNLALGVVVGVLPRGKWLSFGEKNDFSKAPAAPHTQPPEATAYQHIMRYKDGTSVSFDRETHAMDVELREKAEEDPGVSLNITLKEKKGVFTLLLGDAAEPKTKVEFSTENGVKLGVGENYIELKEDCITLKSKTLVIDAADGFTMTSKNINFDDSAEINATSEKITLKAGTTLEISSGGADVK